MIEKLIARMIADEIKLAKFEKNTTKSLKQMKKQKKKKKTKKLNLNKNLPDLNIIKYFYLNMTRLINVNKVNYINFFKLKAKLKRCFQYQFNFSLFLTRRVEVSLSFIIYKHEYIKAEARNML